MFCKKNVGDFGTKCEIYIIPFKKWPPGSGLIFHVYIYTFPEETTGLIYIHIYTCIASIYTPVSALGLS